MLNSDLHFPYPLLRTETEDFQTAIFSDDMDVIRESNGFRVVPRFSVNNDQIQNLIDTKAFSYGLQIQCSSTYYREVKYIERNRDFLIPSGLVHDQVDICPCIIAINDLDSYAVDDFVPAFQGIPMKVHSGDVVGIGKVRRFRAYYKADEVKKASSIIKFNADDIDRLRIKLDDDNIMVYLPREQYELYTDLGVSATSDQMSMLMGVLYVPALTQAISEIKLDDDSDSDGSYAGYPWYDSLMASLDRMADGDQARIEELVNNPFETAQRLLDDSVARTLIILKNREW